MKSVPMWLLAAAPYGLLGAVLCAGENNTILRLSLALYAAVLAGNVACALVLPRRGYAPEKLLLCSAVQARGDRPVPRIAGLSKI